MVSSAAKTVPEYLDSLPPDRRAAIAAVRKLIKQNLPKGFEEAMGFGMISYHVPLRRFPDTHNKQPLCLAALEERQEARHGQIVRSLPLRRRSAA